ncbi:glycosyltransferase [Epibacterium sp. SM1979]|uniref:Glycosyltransferase n=1 Tax=Tritonibacter litoralis TaxID=2662264 RepID=A0A843YBM9_9RHOB|nr:glycosyltransferase family 2 protein [Tritonibacter litoralis]MQQ08406.1 glycosyltransferase [Tritonibacter litoralis]
MTAPERDLQNNPAVDASSILVAIPTLNEEAHIAATLTAILGDNPEMKTVKIVVADGGSTDRTCAIVQDMAQTHPNIHLINNPDKIQAAAINKIVADCAEPHHTIMVRVDAHAHYPADYVLKVAQSLVAHAASGLATVMDSVGTTCFQKGSAWAMETKIGSGGSGHRGGTTSGYVDHGHHAGFDLAMYRKVGGYDTSFVANEDAELDHRINQAGGRIWLDATIRMDYVMRGSLGKLSKQYWRYGKGRAQNILRHKMKPRPRQMIPPVILVVNLLSLLLAPLLPVFLLLPLAYVGLLAATSAALVAKHKSLCALWAGPALLAMHQAWGAGFLSHMIGHRGQS